MSLFKHSVLTSFPNGFTQSSLKVRKLNPGIFKDLFKVHTVPVISVFFSCDLNNNRWQRVCSSENLPTGNGSATHERPGRLGAVHEGAPGEGGGVRDKRIDKSKHARVAARGGSFILRAFVPQLREMPLRRKKVENYELKIHSLMLDNTCKYSLIQIERSDQAQVGAAAHPGGRSLRTGVPQFVTLRDSSTAAGCREGASEDQGHQNDRLAQADQARGSDRGEHLQPGQHDEKDQEVVLSLSHTSTHTRTIILLIPPPELVITSPCFLLQHGDGAEEPPGTVFRSGETVQGQEPVPVRRLQAQHPAVRTHTRPNQVSRLCYGDLELHGSGFEVSRERSIVVL